MPLLKVMACGRKGRMSYIHLIGGLTTLIVIVTSHSTYITLVTYRKLPFSAGKKLVCNALQMCSLRITALKTLLFMTPHYTLHED